MKKRIDFLNNMKVRTKLNFVYLLTGFLPICMVCFVFFEQMSKVLEEREINNLDVTLEQAVESLDTELQLHAKMSDYIAFNQTIAVIISNMEKNNFDAYQRIVKEFDPMMDYLEFVNSNISQITVYAYNDIIPHGSHLRPISEVRDKSWISVEDRDIHWYADRDTGMVELVRAMDSSNSSGGVLYVSMGYEELFKVMQLQNVNSYSLFVYDGDTPLYEYQTGEEDEQLSFERFQQIKNTRNNDYVILEHQLEENQWTVGCVMQKDQVLSSLENLLLQVFCIWGFCSALSLMLIISFARNLSGRIVKLNTAMEEVEGGNLEVEVSDSQKDEIGDLSIGFNHMVAELRRLIKEVYQAQISQKKYEMTALRAQINPHFLYNSLSLINWRALEIGADDISKATLALSRYYRTSLNKGKNVMPIREELDNVRAYLEIQEMFHNYSFEVKTEIDPEVMEYETLNLVLQPLAENAVHHGIDRKRDGKGIIVIGARLEGEEVVLFVRDNGNGMSDEKAASILTNKSSGYGVRNVDSRIKLQYGEQYGLTIHSTEGEGTEILVRFPAVELG